jgi:hypothetical protein
MRSIIRPTHSWITRSKGALFLYFDITRFLNYEISSGEHQIFLIFHSWG